MAPLSGEVTYLINHVVLPPQLPQADDFNVAHENVLLETTKLALEDLKKVLKAAHVQTVTSAIATVQNLIRSRDKDGNVNETQLQVLLRELCEGTLDGAIPLHIKAQNAGIIARRDADQIVF
jgi:hypothetical protein